MCTVLPFIFRITENIFTPHLSNTNLGFSVGSCQVYPELEEELVKSGAFWGRQGRRVDVQDTVWPGLECASC